VLDTEGNLYGVLQLINKVDGIYFSTTDQKSFEVFTIYCSLNIRYIKINKELTKQTAKAELYREIYRDTTLVTNDEVKTFILKISKKNHKTIPTNFDNFSFNIHLASEEDCYFYFLHMCKSVCDPNFLPNDEVIIKFVMTVKNGYRNLPYHNFKHAMTFTHFMYLVIKKHIQLFSSTEPLTLLVSSVAHDIDHLGYSGFFLYDSGHQRGRLYGKKSTNERHHFAITCDVLKRDGCDMFCKLSDDQVNEAYVVMKNSIIATDLNLFFENNNVLSNMLKADDFSLQSIANRQKALQVLMIACDLCMMAKDWSQVKSNIVALYKEFYEEGDERKKLALECIELYDREKSNNIWNAQIGFYSFVLINCYENIAQCFPECEVVTEAIKANLGNCRIEKQKKMDAETNGETYVSITDLINKGRSYQKESDEHNKH